MFDYLFSVVIVIAYSFPIQIYFNMLNFIMIL